MAYLIQRGGKCTRCGCDDLTTLQFHHVNPATKKFGIADALVSRKRSGRSIIEIEAEIDKCEILCANCHHREHCTWANAYDEMVMWASELCKQLARQHFDDLDE